MARVSSALKTLDELGCEASLYFQSTPMRGHLVVSRPSEEMGIADLLFNKNLQVDLDCPTSEYPVVRFLLNRQETYLLGISNSAWLRCMGLAGELSASRLKTDSRKPQITEFVCEWLVDYVEFEAAIEALHENN